MADVSGAYEPIRDTGGMPAGWKPDGTGSQRVDHTPTTCDSSHNVGYDQGYRAALRDAALRFRRSERGWLAEPDNNLSKQPLLTAYGEAARVLDWGASHPQCVPLNTARATPYSADSEAT